MERYQTMTDRMKRDFVDACADVFANSGQRAVVTQAPQLATRYIQELTGWLNDSNSLSPSSKQSILSSFEETLTEAVKQLRFGARGWQYLSAMIGGATIVLAGFGAYGWSAGTIFMVTSSAIVGGVIGHVAGFSCLAMGIFVGVGALIGIATYTLGKWIIDHLDRKKIALLVKDAFNDARRSLDSFCTLVLSTDSESDWTTVSFSPVISENHFESYNSLGETNGIKLSLSTVPKENWSDVASEPHSYNCHQTRLVPRSVSDPAVYKQQV